MARKFLESSATTSAILAMAGVGIAVLSVGIGNVLQTGSKQTLELIGAGSVILLLALIGIYFKEDGDEGGSLSFKDSLVRQAVDIGAPIARYIAKDGQLVRMKVIFEELDQMGLYKQLIRHPELWVDNLPVTPPKSGGRRLYWYEYDCAFCYAHEDSAEAREVMSTFKKAGVCKDYCFDYLNPQQEAGDGGLDVDFLRSMAIGRSARFVVALVSGSFAASTACRAESEVLVLRIQSVPEITRDRSRSVLKLILLDPRGTEFVSAKFPGMIPIGSDAVRLDALANEIANRVPKTGPK